MSRRKEYWLVCAVVATTLAFFPKVYYVRNEASGWVFWNEKTAYVFIGETTDGRPFSYIGLAVEEIRDIFPFGASAPTDHHSSVIVFRLTPSTTRKYSIDNFSLGAIEPFQGTLYVANMLPGGQMMKWSGTNFESATAIELAELRAYLINPSNTRTAGPSYDNVEGWSKRTIAGDIVRRSPTNYLEKDAELTIELYGERLEFVMNSGLISKYAYVDLRRPDQPQERIWQLDERPHRVSMVEDGEIFGHI